MYLDTSTTTQKQSAAPPPANNKIQYKNGAKSKEKWIIPIS